LTGRKVIEKAKTKDVVPEKISIHFK
jgi:hypothetical protein